MCRCVRKGAVCKTQSPCALVLLLPGCELHERGKSEPGTAFKFRSEWFAVVVVAFGLTCCSWGIAGRKFTAKFSQHSLQQVAGHHSHVQPEQQTLDVAMGLMGCPSATVLS